jgi:hypothetical protein
MGLEQVIQIISILTFLGTSIVFFIKLGELKTSYAKDIEQLQHDVLDLQEENKEIKKEVEDIKQATNQSVLEVKTLLIEVKTKIELLMQITGLFNKHENIKK